MNYRNHKMIIGVRVLLGLFLIMSGVGGLMAVKDLSQIPVAMQPYMKTLIDTGLFYLIKITELVVGAMLVLGFLPALAAIVLAPISMGILVFHLSVAPAIGDMWGGLLVAALNIYLGYVYWDKYRPLFERK